MGGIDGAKTPLEARCDRCAQVRPLFLYEVQHGHFGGAAFTCTWCNRQQPLLCVRCTDKERAAEDADPALQREQQVMERICETNRAYAERMRGTS